MLQNLFPNEVGIHFIDYFECVADALVIQSRWYKEQSGGYEENISVHGSGAEELTLGKKWFSIERIQKFLDIHHRKSVCSEKGFICRVDKGTLHFQEYKKAPTLCTWSQETSSAWTPKNTDLSTMTSGDKIPRMYHGGKPYETGARMCLSIK